MGRIVTLRFRDPIPLCPGLAPGTRGCGARRSEWGGAPVRVYLPPIPTAPGRCSEPLVWRVVAEDVMRIAGAEYAEANVVVCEHQVDVD